MDSSFVLSLPPVDKHNFELDHQASNYVYLDSLMEEDFEKVSSPPLHVKSNHVNKSQYCSYPTNFSEHKIDNFNTNTLCPQDSIFEGTTSVPSLPFFVFINVCCSVIGVFFVGIDMKLVAWIACELVKTCMFGCKWLMYGLCVDGPQHAYQLGDVMNFLIMLLHTCVEDAIHMIWRGSKSLRELLRWFRGCLTCFGAACGWQSCCGAV